MWSLNCISNIIGIYTQLYNIVVKGLSGTHDF